MTTKPKFEPKVGDRVLVKGQRSVSNARLRAAGVVKAVHPNGSIDVEAAVDGRGLVLLAGMRANSLLPQPKE